MNPATVNEKHEEFRDSISTITAEGKRAWIYPKKPKGKLFDKRKIVSYFFLVLFFAMPWMKINGHPFMLLNVVERKFVLFGISFFPQDFFLFVLAMLTFVVFITLFTTLFGRVWCGWACPQTIFMEMVFRRIEYWIEGDRVQQMNLDRHDWDFYKASRKIFKHLLFFLIAFIISNTFLAYIIGVDEWKKIIAEDISEHKAGFISILVFTGVFYGVYARFREQVCIVVCPYGRLQSVLLDPNSVVVGYDYGRGEPRGKLTNASVNKTGDCIDCHLCVQVCPTGIDIRNGTQLECINCTACIDACNSIMQKIKKPVGLIRYTSENAIKNKIKFRITPRIIGYSAVLLVLFSSLVTLLAIRSDIETIVLRTPGLLFQENNDGTVSNLYNIEMVNKTYSDIPLRIVPENKKAVVKWIGKDLVLLKDQSVFQGEFFLFLPADEIKKTKTKIRFDVYSGDKIIDHAETSFLGPNHH